MYRGEAALIIQRLWRSYLIKIQRSRLDRLRKMLETYSVFSGEISVDDMLLMLPN